MSLSQVKLSLALSAAWVCFSYTVLACICTTVRTGRKGQVGSHPVPGATSAVIDDPRTVLMELKGADQHQH